MGSDKTQTENAVETAKADPRTVKSLTEALELLQSAVNKVKGGEAVDPKGLGKIVDAVMRIKERYPSPKSKTMNATEFVSYAKSAWDEIQQAEPSTRVARLAQLQAQIDAARKQVEAGSSTVEIEDINVDDQAATPETKEVSPFENQTLPETNFAELNETIKNLSGLVKDLNERVEKSEIPPEEDTTWVNDLAGDPATSDDPTLSWGVEKREAPEDWGKDYTGD